MSAQGAKRTKTKRAKAKRAKTKRAKTERAETERSKTAGERSKTKRAETKRSKTAGERSKTADKRSAPHVEHPERRQRRALSHVGGRIDLSGSDHSDVLRHALEVGADERSVMAHVHGFHSYPARLHPQTAARLVKGLSKPGDAVLDPFCGSGTVLVEARRLGRRALGIDANPLAVLLSRFKARGASPAECEALSTAVSAVAEHAEARRERRAGPTQRYPDIDRELFEPHVLLELDGLRAGISLATNDPWLDDALKLILSSILVKVSRQPGDTTTRQRQRRLPGGHTIRLFTRKADELCRRLGQVGYPADAPEAEVRLGDARTPGRMTPIRLAVSSPPYPGVYDYSAHHAARLRWLELDAKHIERNEIGARRHFATLPFARALGGWEAELGAVLDGLANVLVGDGALALVIADSVLADRAVFADALVRRLAPKHGFQLTTQASQQRPHFHAPTARAFGRRPRREHLLLLRKR